MEDPRLARFQEKDLPGPAPTVQAPERRWHAEPVEAVEAALDTSCTSGLSRAEAANRLRRFGLNTIEQARSEPWWEEIVESLTEPLVLLLLVVAAVYALIGALSDALTILAVILLVAIIEAANESRARRAIASLRLLTAPAAPVVRDRQIYEVAARELVPGDVVLLEPGERVPADLRLTETAGLRIDEAPLTGESVPVIKQADVVLAPETDLGDRRNLAFAGTIVTTGRGRGIVVATGSETAFGRIARLTEVAREPRTPLQDSLRQLAGWLLWLAVGFSILIPILSVAVARQSLQESVLTGLTLAFATIPEELPILVTLVLGLGAYRLARRNAVVKRLSAAETLGSVSVVCTDKTGTLTENRMEVVEVVTAEGTQRRPVLASTATLRRLLEIAVLANDAQITPDDGQPGTIGDPTEIALLVAAERAGVSIDKVRSACSVVAENPFDHVRGRMSVIVRDAFGRWLAVKGAPEAVLAISSRVLVEGSIVPLDVTHRQLFQDAADQMAARGLRVLACAERQLDPDEDDNTDREMALTLVGLIGLEDPPRPDVASAIATLRAAGVRVLMLTGDHPATARAIAERVGIDARQVIVGRDLEGTTSADLRRLIETVSVFARITPEHKLRVVQALEESGQVVAVTGDGINDAPALRKAAIGIAMGRIGTDVAREAADLVLADDNFATITTAVRDGRALFENLRKAVRYYLAAKVALIGASFLAVLAHLPVPLVPVQIIVTELFMDLGASTTFVVEPPEHDVMARPPRDPRKRFMDRSMQLVIFGGGASLATTVLASYVWVLAHGDGVLSAQSAAFAAWMLGHLVLAAHLRSEREPLAQLGLTTNPMFILWAVAAVALVPVGMLIPFVQQRLHLVPLPFTTWVVVVASALLLPSWWEIVKAFRTRRGRKAETRG